jgi:hypothetical protein
MDAALFNKPVQVFTVHHKRSSRAAVFATVDGTTAADALGSRRRVLDHRVQEASSCHAVPDAGHGCGVRQLAAE